MKTLKKQFFFMVVPKNSTIVWVKLPLSYLAECYSNSLQVFIIILRSNSFCGSHKDKILLKFVLYL